MKLTASIEQVLTDSLLRETVSQLLQPGPIQAERAKVVLERLKRMATL